LYNVLREENMKISLRKANAVQGLINEQINQKFGNGVSINKYADAAKVIEEATADVLETIQKKFSLIGVLYTIREKVADAGHKAGVAALLSELAGLSKEEEFSKQIAATPSFLPPLKSVLSSIEDLKKEPAPSGNYSYSREGVLCATVKDNVEVPLLTKEFVETHRKSAVDIRKEKQKLSDMLLHLNVSTEIELSPFEETVLTKYDII
jgi:hypothetical protein